MANRSFEGKNTQDTGRSKRRVERPSQDELIPGLPNEISVDLIATKLPVADVLALPLISRAWQQAVQRKEVRNARIQKATSQLLNVVPVIDLTSERTKIRLALSSSDNSFFRLLPPLPHSWERNDRVHYRKVCLAGTIHILVVKKRHITIRTTAYSFDVTRGGHWIECARSHVIIWNFLRKSMSCVKDGKFYVSGLLFPPLVGLGHMVYDPQLDSWSSTRDFRHETRTGRCICSSTGKVDLLYDLLV